MNRTIQTALTLFPERVALIVSLFISGLICVNRMTLFVTKGGHVERCPDLDFSLCADQWDYDPHTFGAASSRAEQVRKELSKLLGLML